jgi:hypothetical protein
MEVLECRPRGGALWSVTDGGGMHGRHGPRAFFLIQIEWGG